MIKTIDFAGIELDNYTVREMIMNVEKDMSDHGFHTIEEVNMDTLMLAETDELVRKAIGFAEHTVIAENGILEAVGAGSYQHRHEIEHHDFFFELMKRVEQSSDGVCDRRYRGTCGKDLCFFVRAFWKMRDPGSRSV